MDGSRPLRIVSLVQAETVTGPVKPLLLLSQEQGREDYRGPRHLRTCLTTRRRRSGDDGPSGFERAAAVACLDLKVIPEGFRFDPRILGPMRRALLEARPDIVESHDSKSHVLVRMLRATLPATHRFRWIAFHHGYTRTSLAVRSYQQLDRLTLPQADVVVTLCRPFVTDLQRRGVPRSKIHVLSNFVNRRPRVPMDECEALRRRLGLDPGDMVLLSVGRLSSEKGHGDLLDALSGVPDRLDGRQVRLLLVGDGPEMSRLKAQAAPLGDQVVFAGFQPDPWAYFCLSDIFVLPSHSEGSPLVLLEAMTAGLPIVATVVGGVPEMVENGTSALLVQPGHPSDLAKVVTDVVRQQDVRRQLSIAARDRVELFSVERYASRLLDVYEIAMEEQKPTHERAASK